MTNPDVRLDSESVSAVARRAEKIADALPRGISKPRDAAEAVRSANDSSLAAAALQEGFQQWSEQYDLLTRQVAGFAGDLHAAVATWDAMEGANVDIFTKYGKDL